MASSIRTTPPALDPGNIPTNYEHKHMRWSSNSEKNRYFKIKHRVLTSLGIVLWCQYCDGMIRRQCILNSAEQSFFDTVLEGKIPNSPERQIIEIPTGTQQGRKRKRRTRKQKKLERENATIFESITKPKTNGIRGLLRIRRGKSRKIPAQIPYTIPAENITDLPDLSEKLRPPQQLSKIKMNVTNKPSVNTAKIRDKIMDVEATTAAAHDPGTANARTIKTAKVATSTILNSKQVPIDDQLMKSQKACLSNIEPINQVCSSPSIKESDCSDISNVNKDTNTTSVEVIELDSEPNPIPGPSSAALATPIKLKILNRKRSPIQPSTSVKVIDLDPEPNPELSSAALAETVTSAIVDSEQIPFLNESTKSTITPNVQSTKEGCIFSSLIEFEPNAISNCNMGRPNLSWMNVIDLDPEPSSISGPSSTPLANQKSTIEKSVNIPTENVFQHTHPAANQKSIIEKSVNIPTENVFQSTHRAANQKSSIEKSVNIPTENMFQNTHRAANQKSTIEKSVNIPTENVFQNTHRAANQKSTIEKSVNIPTENMFQNTHRAANQKSTIEKSVNIPTENVLQNTHRAVNQKSTIEKSVNIPTENVFQNTHRAANQKSTIEKSVNILTEKLFLNTHRAGIPKDFDDWLMPGEINMSTEPHEAKQESRGLNSDPKPWMSSMPDIAISVHQKVPPLSNNDELLRLNKTEPRQETITRDPTDDSIPVDQREEIVCSVDKTVKALVRIWPWETNISSSREVSFLANWNPRNPKRIFSRKAVEDEFKIIVKRGQERGFWIKVTVTGYPKNWTRVQVLNKLVNWENISELPFVPCFIEFSHHRCKFLVRDSTVTLQRLFARGLVVAGDGWRLNLTVTLLTIGLNELRFRLHRFLSCRVNDCYRQKRNSLDLTEFMLQPDISMMCYFPLNNAYNQRYIVQLDTDIKWNMLTKLVLAGNQLMSIDHFDLLKNTPALQSLDLSENWLQSVSRLACCRGMLSIRSLRLEGNPLCPNYINQEQYVDVIKLMFPKIDHLDGVRVSGRPAPLRNFCPEPAARALVDQFLEQYFGLLETKSRERIVNMYSKHALFTVSCQSKLKKNPEYEHIDLFRVSRDIRLLNDLYESSISGCESIARHLGAWLPVLHDPYSFTVDVLSHTETGVVVTLTGTMRVLSRPQLPECPMFDFGRTFALSTRDGERYYIENDMLHLAEVSPERAAAAFQHPKKPQLTLHLESAPDEELASGLVSILMELTKLNRRQCSRCLEMRNWDIRAAIQYFLDLQKKDELSTLDAMAAAVPSQET